jgi:hypothetical protein
MMGRQAGDQSQLFYLFNPEDRIPEHPASSDGEPRRMSHFPIRRQVSAAPYFHAVIPMTAESPACDVPSCISNSCSAIFRLCNSPNACSSMVRV